MEAWYQLGEVLFHRNGLRGLPFTESREAFERVLSLEPRQFSSMIHLARIEAFEGHDREMDKLVTRFLGQGQEAGQRNTEIRALRAFSSVGGKPERDAVLSELRRGDGASLAMAFAEVSLYDRNLDGAEQIAQIMMVPSRNATVRSFGHVALAHLRLAQGRWDEAQRTLAALSKFDEWTAQEYLALFAALPFLPVSRGELATVRSGLEKLDPANVLEVDERTVFVETHQDLHALIRAYLLALLSARMGDVGQGDSFTSQIRKQTVPAEYGALAADLALGAEAQVARARGKPVEALALLGRIPSEPRNPMESPIVSLAYERFTKAQLLFESGRYEESLAWHEHIAESSVFEFVYAPISHLFCGEILAKLGRVAEAGEQYARFVEAWRSCDDSLQPMVDLARRKKAQLAGQSDSQDRQVPARASTEGPRDGR